MLSKSLVTRFAPHISAHCALFQSHVCLDKGKSTLTRALCAVIRKCNCQFTNGFSLLQRTPERASMCKCVVCAVVYGSNMILWGSSRCSHTHTINLNQHNHASVSRNVSNWFGHNPFASGAQMARRKAGETRTVCSCRCAAGFEHTARECWDMRWLWEYDHNIPSNACIPLLDCKTPSADNNFEYSERHTQTKKMCRDFSRIIVKCNTQKPLVTLDMDIHIHTDRHQTIALEYMRVFFPNHVLHRHAHNSHLR